METLIDRKYASSVHMLLENLSGTICPGCPDEGAILDVVEIKSIPEIRVKCDRIKDILGHARDMLNDMRK